MNNTKYVITGLFVIGGLALLAILIVWFEGLPGLLRGTYTVRAHLANSMGIRESKRVHRDGIAIGDVTAVTSSLPDEPGVWVVMRISAAEKILLEGVPNPIKTSCVPRRSDLPTGTLAALQCPPSASPVRDLAYYLMSGSAATNVFRQRMIDNGVKGGPGQCRNGKSVLSVDVPGPGALGCYVNASGRANLRIVEPASGCNQLKVGDRTLKIPAIYVAVLGSDGDIRKLARWAESPLGQGGLIKTITRPNMPLSPRCPS